VEALVSNGKPEDVRKEPLVCGKETEVGEVEVLVELVLLGGTTMSETRVGSGLFQRVSPVRWCAEENRKRWVMTNDPLPARKARAHYGITVLSIEMDAGMVIGAKLNGCTVARPFCSTGQQLASVERVTGKRKARGIHKSYGGQC
jgi:hypothetical protein